VAVTTTSHVSVVQNVASGDPAQKKNNPCVLCLTQILIASISAAGLIFNSFEDCIMHAWIYGNSVKEIVPCSSNFPESSQNQKN